MNNTTDPISISRKRWILANFRASWWRLAICVLISLGSAVLQLLDPWPLKIILDSVFGNVPAPLFLESLTGTYGLLIAVAFIYVGLYVISGIVGIIDSYVTAKFTFRLNIKLQTEFFNHIINLPLESRSKIDNGDYVYRLNEQADNIPALIFGVSVAIITNIFMVVSAIVILALLNWQLAIVGVLIVPLLFLSIRYFTPKIGTLSDAIATDSSEIYNQSNESIENATLVQSFNRQKFQTEKINNLFASRARKGLRLSLLDGTFGFTNSITTAIGVVVVLLIGGNEVFNQTLTVGELIIFITYMSYLYDPIESILSNIGDYKELLAGIKLVQEVRDEKAEVVDEKTGAKLYNTKGSIVFDDVSYSHADEMVLSHVSLTIPAGQKVAFVGPSGGGKSTLLSLLLRINTPQSGSIYIDNQEIKDININSLRDQFSVALQESGLFSGTVMENIEFSTPDKKPEFEDVITATQQASAYEFVSELPDGFKTSISESGNNLSGGQKQRISLARAFIKKSPVLLLDEPTSALDKISSGHVINAIKMMMHGRTVLMVTHDPSLLHAMDSVYIVEDASIKRIQNKDELGSYVQSMMKQQQADHAYDFLN